MLYLIQHAESFQEEPRAITEKGRADTEKIAAFLKKAGIKPAETWHSTKLRARQTAEIIALAPLIEKEDLAPNDDPKKWLNELNMLNKEVMIVGHLPFLSKLASLLLTGDEGRQIIKFRNSGVVCFEKEAGNWLVRWIIWPEIV